MLSFHSEKTQTLKSNVILYQVNMSQKPLSYFGLIKCLYRKEDTQDRKKVSFFTDPSYQQICLFICFFSFFFLFFYGIYRLYGKEKLERLVYLEDFFNCKDKPGKKLQDDLGVGIIICMLEASVLLRLLLHDHGLPSSCLFW